MKTTHNIGGNVNQSIIKGDGWFIQTPPRPDCHLERYWNTNSPGTPPCSYNSRTSALWWNTL